MAMLLRLRRGRHHDAAAAGAAVVADGAPASGVASFCFFIFGHLPFSGILGNLYQLLRMALTHGLTA